MGARGPIKRLDNMQERLDLGRRLELIRHYMEMTQTKFAGQAGLGLTTYNNYVQGKKRISLDVAWALCEEYDLSLDYIYRGDPSNLPLDLRSYVRRKLSGPTGSGQSNL